MSNPQNEVQTLEIRTPKAESPKGQFPVANPQNSLQAVFANIEQGLFLVGPDGQVNYCNSHLEDLVGIKLADVLDQPYQNLLRDIAALSINEPKTIQELLGAVKDLHERANVNLQTRDAVDCHLQIKLFPVFDLTAAPPKRIGFGGFVLDTTADWDEVTQWTDHLSAMTQSLRAQVATIKGFVTTLLSGHRYWEENERQGFLESINEHVDQLGRLVENAQELFKLELDAVELDRRPTDIKRLLQRVIQSLAFQRSGHHFVLDIPDDLPPAEIDSLRVEQVLHNVLENAVKYSPRDKKIRISAELKGREVQVTVADQGTGISYEQLTRIFEGAYQAGYGSPELSRGMGMGLYVARGLVLAHYGRIWAENIQGQGTTICFTLPLEATKAAAKTSETTPRKTTSLPPQNTPSAEVRPNREIAKILVIDDDPQMLRLLKIKLEVEGFAVITATRGNVALELAVVEQPDVILLDVSLPDTNGFDVCSRLREFTAVPVIMITGQSREEDMVRGLDVGADDYLVKPVRNKELLARVRANLRRSRVPETAPSKPIFRYNDLQIDFAQRQVTVRSQPVRLTPTEYKLLYHLAVNAGRILTHSQLLSKVWGPGYEEDTQYLWVNISRLRGKLESNPSAPEYIMTEPGVGYYLPDGSKNG
jgi:two-component system KDP operon response regulator KdpE